MGEKELRGIDALLGDGGISDVDAVILSNSKHSIVSWLLEMESD